MINKVPGVDATIVPVSIIDKVPALLVYCFGLLFLLSKFSVIPLCLGKEPITMPSTKLAEGLKF